MRTNQYAFVLVLQVVLLLGTFTAEAKMFDAWRSQNALPDTTQVQPVDGDQQESLLGYLSR